MPMSRLQKRLAEKVSELNRRENSQGTYHDVQKMTKLRMEIEQIKRRMSNVG